MTLQIDNLGLEEIAETIFSIDDSKSFEKVSLAVFNYQYYNCIVYKKFCDILRCIPENVSKIEQIPFMPISFFRDHSIFCLSREADLCFKSSTTTDSVPAKHFVSYQSLYDESIRRCFERFYGDVSKYCILALLPGYQDKMNASLVYMVNRLQEWSKFEESGFYLYDHHKLYMKLKELIKKDVKILLIGVSHALLDFAESYPLKLNDTIVMETGGMKGRREELIREDLHSRLKKAFGIDYVASEYGMTELLSQAYALQKGKFYTPPWMQVNIKEINDPFSNLSTGSTGVINVIDLANVFSCSFIATNDLGKQNFDSTFEVLGRMDNSEMRGCNLMVS